jgi:hypothetical protein
LVGVENDQYVAGCSSVAGPHRVAFSPPVLFQHDYSSIRKRVSNAYALIVSAIRAVAFDEHEFKLGNESGDSLDDGLDVSALVSARNQNAHGRSSFA